MFQGRKKELLDLHEEFSSEKKSAILIYGKRRVGKSFLIKKALEDFDGIAVNFLCIKSTFKGNLSLLSKAVSESFAFPNMNFDSLFDLFKFLKAQNKRILVVLDEYQYLKESLKEMEMDSIMQAIIDDFSDNMKIILCGSYISIMKELMNEENPLFGRFTKIVKLEEFDYFDSQLFYPKIPNREKIRFYSVFGGSPYILSNLDFSKTIEENIIEKLINQNSIFRTYIENIMLREIQKSFDIRILESLKNGKKRFNEILHFVSASDSSLLDKQLKNLLQMETINKIFPINKKSDKKKQFYELNDNLMRFYFAYIFGNDNLILKFGEKEFFEKKISSSLNTFVSLRFEKIANQYFMRLAHQGKLKEIEDFGSFWYDDKKNSKNGQFDCVLKRKDSYDFYEVKFFENPMILSECEKEESQINGILKEQNIKIGKIGFICSEGFKFSSEKYVLLDAKDLYKPNLEL